MKRQKKKDKGERKSKQKRDEEINKEGIHEEMKE